MFLARTRDQVRGLLITIPSNINYEKKPYPFQLSSKLFETILLLSCHVIIFQNYKFSHRTDILVSSDVRPYQNLAYILRHLSSTGFLIFLQRTFEFPSLCVA